MNYLSVGVSIPVTGSSEEPEEEVEKTIRNQKDKNDLARLFYTAKTVGSSGPPSTKELNQRINSYNTGNNFT